MVNSYLRRYVNCNRSPTLFEGPGTNGAQGANGVIGGRACQSCLCNLDTTRSLWKEHSFMKKNFILLLYIHIYILYIYIYMMWWDCRISQGSCFASGFDKPLKFKRRMKSAHEIFSMLLAGIFKVRWNQNDEDPHPPPQNARSGRWRGWWWRSWEQCQRLIS